MSKADRLSAVDLRELSEAQMTALKREAIRRRISFPELLGQLADEVSTEMIQRKTAAREVAAH